MAYVPVPKDLTKVKTKVMFNLTKRQLICFTGGALIGVPLFFLLRKPTGNSVAGYVYDAGYAALLYAGYVRKAWTAAGKDRGQHSQSSCDPSKAATLPDQQLLCRIKAAGNAR